MVNSLMKICANYRLLRLVISDSAKYNQWNNSSWQVPSAFYMQRQYFSQAIKRSTRHLREINARGHKKPKAYKQKVPIVEVWDNMTMSEIMETFHTTPNQMQSALEKIKPNLIFDKSAVFTDRDVLYAFLKELNVQFKRIDDKVKEDKDVYRRPPPDDSVLVQRPPIIAVMGHVDHGKTTLLDTLRNTSVAKSEAGGITQSIGVFNVSLGKSMCATFLDTPGHAAFNAMRERGASATDIIILIVAADDGVMKQTVDTIDIARELNSRLIVAINKIDKPDADIERTQQMLAERGVTVEQLNGDVQCVPISALKGTNLDKLMEAIRLEADVLELKGDRTGFVEGVIIESSIRVNFGPVATVLVQRGTLRKGAVLVAKQAMAKVRVMLDYSGKPVTEAGLSQAVQVIGWKGLPHAGDEVLEVQNEKKANVVLKYRAQKLKVPVIQKETENASEKENATEKAEVPDLNVIIKADMYGSVEAIMNILSTYDEHDKCRLKIVHHGVGNVTETDLELAKTFNAIIYGFNVSISSNIKQQNEKAFANIHQFNVIYKLIDNIKEELVKRYPRLTVEEVIGEATTLQVFMINEKRKKIPVAGCLCTDGTIFKSSKVHIVRNGETIYTGEITSLKHKKDEVPKVEKGTECGIKLDNNDFVFEVGDTLVFFEIVSKEQTLDWDPGF